MIAFVDSSALVKLYVDEVGAAEVRAAMRDVYVYVSTLAGVEVPSALWKKARTGEASHSEVRTLVGRFAADMYGVTPARGRFLHVLTPQHILDAAVTMIERYGLRAFDSVQLASAIAARRANPACQAFACFDKDLASAAASEGFDIVFAPS